jgi:hypothetical protein
MARQMTKPRAPLTFSLAITTIAGRIGWKAAAAVSRRSMRAVRYWSESDQAPMPTLDQAIALDRAFIEAGGGCAPILESYARQLDIQLTRSMACRAALASEIALASLETADAISSSIHAMQADASPTIIHCAVKETEEASNALQRLLCRLRSFLPGGVSHPRIEERGN